jgi:hypothetical protein
MVAVERAPAPVASGVARGLTWRGRSHQKGPREYRAAKHSGVIGALAHGSGRCDDRPRRAVPSFHPFGGLAGEMDGADL